MMMRTMVTISFLYVGQLSGWLVRLVTKRCQWYLGRGPKKWKTCKTFDNYDDKMCSDDDDKLALVRGVSHIWCAPGGQMNIAGHI